MRKQTWFGCVICVLSMIPGYLVGGLAAIIYRVTTGLEVGDDPDFYFMRTLFGIETPGKIVGWVFYSAFPAFVRGAAAGAVAMLITSYIYKGVRFDLAAFVTGGMLTGVGGVSIFISYMIHGLNPSMVTIVIENVGVWIGLLAIAEHLTNTSKIKNPPPWAGE